MNQDIFKDLKNENLFLKEKIQTLESKLQSLESSLNDLDKRIDNLVCKNDLKERSFNYISRG